MADQQLDNKKKPNKAASDPKDRSRRSALKKLAIGAGVLTGYQVLPIQWTKPLIEQVVLPVHAQTSGFSLTDPCESVTLVSGNQDSTTVIINVQGSVSPPTANVAIFIVATVTGGTGESTTANTVTNTNGQYTLNGIVVNGGPGIISVNVEITAAGATGSANCSVTVPDIATTSSCPCQTTITLYNNTARSISIIHFDCDEYKTIYNSSSENKFTADENSPVIISIYNSPEPNIESIGCLQQYIAYYSGEYKVIGYKVNSCCSTSTITVFYDD